jgi:hypothetical protein
MQILCVLERIVCGDPHQLFTFFLVLLHSRMLSCLCRIPLLRENLCCARSTVSALGVLHAALRQPRNDQCFLSQQCAHGSKARTYVWWEQTPKASRPASKRRAEIRCSVSSSWDAGGLSMALALAHIPVSSETNLKVSSSRIESLEFGGEFRRELVKSSR